MLAQKSWMRYLPSPPLNTNFCACLSSLGSSGVKNNYLLRALHLNVALVRWAVTILKQGCGSRWCPHTWICQRYGRPCPDVRLCRSVVDHIPRCNMAGLYCCASIIWQMYRGTRSFLELWATKWGIHHIYHFVFFRYLWGLLRTLYLSPLYIHEPPVDNSTIFYLR